MGRSKKKKVGQSEEEEKEGDEGEKEGDEQDGRRGRGLESKGS